MAEAVCYMASVSSKERPKTYQVAAMPFQDTAEVDAGLGITALLLVGMHWQ